MILLCNCVMRVWCTTVCVLVYIYACAHTCERMCNCARVLAPCRLQHRPLSILQPVGVLSQEEHLYRQRLHRHSQHPGAKRGTRPKDSAPCCSRRSLRLCARAPRLPHQEHPFLRAPQQVKRPGALPPSHENCVTVRILMDLTVHV